MQRAGCGEKTCTQDKENAGHYSQKGQGCAETDKLPGDGAGADKQGNE